MTRSSAFRLVAVTCVVLTLSYASFVHSFVSITASSNPALALRLAPANAAALANLAEARLAVATNPGEGADIARLARRSLQSQALNPKAVRLLAFTRELARDDAGAANLMRLADQATSRDLATHIWMIEQAVVQNRVDLALERYDLALRTSGQGTNLLFPILDNALGDERLRQHFSRFLASDAPWVSSFVEYELTHSNAVANLALAIGRNGGLKSRDGEALTSALVKRLIISREYAAARALYLTMKGARNSALVSLSLDATAVDPRFGGFSWERLESPDLDAGFEGIGAGTAHRILLSARPQSQGRAVRKLVFLPPGVYQLTGGIRSLGGADPGAVQFWFGCMPVETGSAQKSSIAAGPRLTAFRARFTVETCPVQEASFFVSGSDGQEDTLLAIEGLQLRRATASATR